MKHFFAICMAVITFTACNTSVNQELQKQKEWNNEYFAAAEQAESSPQIVNDLFLGFRFGMTPNEVNQHIKKLRKEEKIHIDQSGHYYYLFHTDLGDAKMTFSPDYYHDSLYRMKYNFENGQVLSGKVIVYKAMELFEKANADYKSYIVQLEGLEDFDPDYYQIKHNLIVHFDLVGACMTYDNAPVINSIKMDKKRLQDKTLSDF